MVFRDGDTSQSRQSARSHADWIALPRTDGQTSARLHLMHLMFEAEVIARVSTGRRQPAPHADAPSPADAILCVAIAALGPSLRGHAMALQAMVRRQC